MVKYEVTNKSNIRKYCYGVQLEPGETEELDILVKEAEEIPSASFDVERVEEPESSQAAEESDDSGNENPENEEDSGGE